MKLRTNQKPQSAGIARNGAKHDDILETIVTCFQHAICDILTTDVYDGTFCEANNARHFKINHADHFELLVNKAR
jgi:hypothetical protein